MRMHATVQVREAKEQHVRESELLSSELHELQQEMVRTCTHAYMVAWLHTHMHVSTCSCEHARLWARTQVSASMKSCSMHTLAHRLAQ